MMKWKLKATQIVVGWWEGHDGLSFSLLPLDNSGRVCCYSITEEGWIPYTTEIAE
jgi:hypothetical protein